MNKVAMWALASCARMSYGWLKTKAANDETERGVDAGGSEETAESA